MRSSGAALAALAAAASALLLLGPGWLQLAPPGDPSSPANVASQQKENLELPKLFHLDDYQRCLSRPGGFYCLGTFQLTGPDSSELMQLLKEHSSDRFNYNRTLLHRGLCVSKRAPAGTSSPGQFSRLVADWAHHDLGLRTRLLQLDYCKTHQQYTAPAKVDAADRTFAYVAAAILAANVLGTLYDVFRSDDKKPFRWLMAFSLRVSWSRLTADHSAGDPRLNALNPIQGGKVFTIILVLMAHAQFAHIQAYVYNPEFVETFSRIKLMSLFYNGTMLVQAFIVISSFLVCYNLLLSYDGQPRFSFGLFFKCLFYRVARITPINMFVVGLVATWWRHSNDGVLWDPLMAREAVKCRQKFWSQALYINNYVRPYEACLVQTWFLAVDMQLYVVAVVLTLTLARLPNIKRILAGIFCISLTCNFLVIYYWGFKSMVFVVKPEMVRTQLFTEPSFIWLYSSTWASVPGTIAGLFLAVVVFDIQKRGLKPHNSRLLRYAYRASTPSILLLGYFGSWIWDLQHPLLVAVYSTLDRPAFIFLAALSIFGCIHRFYNLWWRFLSWRGFQILSRLTLSVLMLHWSLNLSLIAGMVLPTQASFLILIAYWVTTIVLSFIFAFFTTLLIELPMQRFLQSICI